MAHEVSQPTVVKRESLRFKKYGRGEGVHVSSLSLRSILRTKKCLLPGNMQWARRKKRQSEKK